MDWSLKSSLDGLFAAGNQIAGLSGASSAAATGRYALSLRDGAVVIDKIPYYYWREEGSCSDCYKARCVKESDPYVSCIFPTEPCHTE